MEGESEASPIIKTSSPLPRSLQSTDIFVARFRNYPVSEITLTFLSYNYSTIDTLEGTEVPLLINITMYSKDVEIAS